MNSKEHVPPEVLKILGETYFLGFDKTEYLGPLTRKLKDVRNLFIPPGNAFRNNLDALIAVVSMPILLASGTATEMRFQQLLMAERIRRLPIESDAEHPDGENLSPKDEEDAHRIAHETLNKVLATKDGIKDMGRQAWRFLHAGLQSNEEVASAAHELLRQSAVLCWGALEVLAREVFVVYINANPTTARKVLDHPSTRGRFDLKAISIEVLEVHGFNVSTRMGDVLLQHQDLTELGAIKDVYQVLFPNARSLHAVLGERALWILNQRRHLIVHKRGIVDARYLERTGEKAEPGSVLNILPSELKEYLRLVRDAGIEILSATNPENTSLTPKSDNPARA
jgi:hypothetical protein